MMFPLSRYLREAVERIERCSRRRQTGLHRICIIAFVIHLLIIPQPLPAWQVPGPGVPPAPSGNLDSGFTSWQWLNPLPQGNWLYDVWMIDSGIIYACGEFGTVIKSTNGGGSWQVWHYVQGITTSLVSLWFFNADTGIIVGTHGVILMTCNSGVTWKVIQSGTAENLHSIHFAGVDTGIAVGSGGIILITNDGGATWTARSSPSPVKLNSVWMTTPMIGFAAGDSGLLFGTDDGGDTWYALSSGTTENLFDISFFNVQHGLIIAAYGVLLSTADSGLSWGVSEYLPVEGCDLSTLHGINERSAVVTGRCGIFLTTDTGTTWNFEWGERGTSIDGAYFTDETFGTVVGSGGVIAITSNGGETWKKISTGVSEFLEDIAFPTEKIGIAVGLLNDGEGSNGVILRSTNSGLLWEAQAGDGIRWLSALHCTSELIGTAVGDGGGIYRTTDGGISWVRQISGTTEWLMAVSMRDSDHIFAAGGWGTLIQSTDGGISWTDRSVAEYYQLEEISFAGSLHGIAVGSSVDTFPSPILWTTDGGSTWDLQPSGTRSALHDVFCIDSITAVIVGDSGTILRTSDGGVSWSRRPSGVTTHLRNVIFRNSTSGVTGGVGGTALRTTDGGLTWRAMELPGLFDVASLTMVSPGNGDVAYLCGRNGEILCAAISPLHLKTWTWVGLVDSSWNNPANWTPEGVPLPGDSVIIPPSVHSPIVDSVQQQIVIAALTILSGGKLTITDALPRFVVLADVTVYGTLDIRPPATPTIIVGGNWIVQPGGSSERFAHLVKPGLSTASDEGFVPYRSTVSFSGSGRMAGTFYNLMFDTASTMKSMGNVTVQNQCTMVGNVTMRGTDTVFIQETFAQALVGPGIFSQGTIKRPLQSSSTEPYGFESQETSIGFDGTGTYPASITMTTHPDTIPWDFGSQWEEVTSSTDTVANIVTADSITGFSKWVIGLPRPTSTEGEYDVVILADTIPVVRRVYEISADSGEGFRARLSLRYEQSEVPAGVLEDSLKLLRLEGTVDIKDRPVDIPARFSLAQNYPNPFNPATTIRFELPHASAVTLKIYNVLGEVVVTLVDETRVAGIHNIQYNAPGLASGIYICRLRAENFTAERKLIVIR